MYTKDKNFDVAKAVAVDIVTELNAVRLAYVVGRRAATDAIGDLLVQALRLIDLIAGDEGREAELAKELGKLNIRFHRDTNIELRVIKAVLGKGSSERKLASDYGRLLTNARLQHVGPAGLKAWIQTNGGLAKSTRGDASAKNPERRRPSSASIASRSPASAPASFQSSRSTPAGPQGEKAAEGTDRAYSADPERDNYFVPARPIGQKGDWVLCRCLIGDNNRVTIYEVSADQAPGRVETEGGAEERPSFARVESEQSRSVPNIASNDNSTTRRPDEAAEACDDRVVIQTAPELAGANVAIAVSDTADGENRGPDHSPQTGLQGFVRKYAPRSLSEVSYPCETVENAVLTLSEATFFGSILLFGPPGVGKTTVANLLGRAIAERLGSELISIAAPHHTKTFLSRLPRLDAKNLPLPYVVIVEEVDALSLIRQKGLKLEMESSLATTRWILTANDIRKINPSLIDQVAPVDFSQTNEERLFAHAKRICAAEKSALTDTRIEALVRYARGSVRRLHGLLESNTIAARMKAAEVSRGIKVDLVAPVLLKSPAARVIGACETLMHRYDHSD